MPKLSSSSESDSMVEKTELRTWGACSGPNRARPVLVLGPVAAAALLRAGVRIETPGVRGWFPVRRFGGAGEKRSIKHGHVESARSRLRCLGLAVAVTSDPHM